MVFIENYVALGASMLFGLCALVFGYYLSRSEGYGDFSVGVSYLDVYTIILAVVPLSAMMSYFMISLGAGTMPILGTEVNWLRYFEWGVTTPILIMGIAILSQDRNLVFKAMMLDVIMIGTGFMATTVPMPYRAVAFGLSSLAFLGTAYLLWKPATRKVEERPEVIQKLFCSLRNLTLGVWFIYPIIWIPSAEGLGLLGIEATFLTFTALDLISKIGYAGVVIYNVEKVNKA